MTKSRARTRLPMTVKAYRPRPLAFWIEIGKYVFDGIIYYEELRAVGRVDYQIDITQLTKAEVRQWQAGVARLGMVRQIFLSRSGYHFAVICPRPDGWLHVITPEAWAAQCAHDTSLRGEPENVYVNLATDAATKWSQSNCTFTFDWC